jgi:hypothetical protein
MRFMAQERARFGLTLPPNRGVIIGATTVAEMLEMAEWADSAGGDSVWVGDSIFAKPRPDAMVLLGALAGGMHREPAELHRCRRDHHHVAPHRLRSEAAVQAGYGRGAAVINVKPLGFEM